MFSNAGFRGARSVASHHRAHKRHHFDDDGKPTAREHFRFNMGGCFDLTRTKLFVILALLYLAFNVNFEFLVRRGAGSRDLMMFRRGGDTVSSTPRQFKDWTF